MKIRAVLGELLAGLLLLSPAVGHAQSTRTWVSGVGDDANPCSRTAPCQTFAGAIAKTAAGGEINCLDAGGFGALTITKAIAIKCVGVEGGVLVSGSNGITISAASTDIILLSGLDIEGQQTGLAGISIASAGAVHLVGATIRGFATGIAVLNSASGIHVDINESIIADNSGDGIQAMPTGSFGNRVDIDQSTITNNAGDGIQVSGAGTSAQIKTVVNRSLIAHNGGAGLVLLGNGPLVNVQVESSTFYDNAQGISASGSGAAVRFTRSTITANGTSVSQTGGALALSYGDNAIDGNGSDGTFGTAGLR